MVSHKTILITNQIYHIFNRSIAKEPCLRSKKDMLRMLDIINYYRFYQILRFSKFKLLNANNQQEYLNKITKTEPLVDIYSFSLMPNHYHLLVKQLQTNGITKFFSDVQNSFAKYYNLKNNRNGGVFQNTFKTKSINTIEELIHVSRYVHLNPVTSRLIEFSALKSYRWNSFSWYMNSGLNKFINTNLLLSHFKDLEHLSSFTENQVDYQRKLKLIKKLMLE